MQITGDAEMSETATRLRTGPWVPSTGLMLDGLPLPMLRHLSRDLDEQSPRYRDTITGLNI